MKQNNEEKKQLEFFPKTQRAFLGSLLVLCDSNRFYKVLPLLNKTYKVMPPQRTKI